jgi:hypothetical protein
MASQPVASLDRKGLIKGDVGKAPAKAGME